MKEKFEDDFYIEDSPEKRLHRLEHWEETIDILNYKKYITLTIKYVETDEICGQILLELQEDKVGKFCWFLMFAIHPSLRHRGFGSKLLKYAEDYAAALGAKTIYLTANLRNEEFLIDWYSARGYEKLYRSPDHNNEWLFAKELPGN